MVLPSWNGFWILASLINLFLIYLLGLQSDAFVKIISVMQYRNILLSTAYNLIVICWHYQDIDPARALFGILPEAETRDAVSFSSDLPFSLRWCYFWSMEHFSSSLYMLNKISPGSLLMSRWDLCTELGKYSYCWFVIHPDFKIVTSSGCDFYFKKHVKKPLTKRYNFYTLFLFLDCIMQN